MTKLSRCALAAFVLATSIVASGSSASGATSCSAPPPVPYGYVLGKVENIDQLGNARISYLNPKAMRMSRGADVYQVTCDGVLVKAGHGIVKTFDERSASLQASFAERGFKPESAVGQYVVVDAGGDSAAPGGVAQVDVTNIAPVDGLSRVTLGVGEENGVFPENTGTIVLKGGRRVAFKILTSTRRASTANLSLNQDDIREAERVLVTLRTPRCFGPELIANPSSVQGVAPTGYSFADGVKDAQKLPTFTVVSSIRAAKGGQTYIFDNSGRPIGMATVEASNGKEVTLRLGSIPMVTSPNAQTLARSRILLPKVANAHCAD
jgi:hypothetical protein